MVEALGDDVDELFELMAPWARAVVAAAGRIRGDGGFADRLRRSRSLRRRPRRTLTDSPTNDQELVDRLEEVWASIDSMCANLTEPQWKTPTDLPGWSVQDNVVHISGIESSILGRPAPDHTPPDYDHVKNEVGQRNEVWIDSRRSWSGVDVLDEFREVTAPGSRSCAASPPPTSTPSRGRPPVPAQSAICCRSASSTRGHTSRTSGAPSTNRAISAALSPISRSNASSPRCRTSSGRRWGRPTARRSCST